MNVCFCILKTWNKKIQMHNIGYNYKVSIFEKLKLYKETNPLKVCAIDFQLNKVLPLPTCWANFDKKKNVNPNKTCWDFV